jgi:hypothetical protein
MFNTGQPGKVMDEREGKGPIVPLMKLAAEKGRTGALGVISFQMTQKFK